MKTNFLTFETASKALEYIKANVNTGGEKSINEEVFFGVGSVVYCWYDLVAGVIPQRGINKLFTELHEDEIGGVLAAILKSQGVLCCSCE